MRRFVVSVALAAIISVLVGCAPGDESTDAGWSTYPGGTVVDYQLGGSYEPAEGVGGVARDSTDQPEPGLYNICYVNGFQTQPQARAEWLAQRRDLLLSGANGEPLVDPNWPDEYILDTSTAVARAAILAAISPAIERCAASGFDAVEIDNLDSYGRSESALSVDDAVALATDYADLAHSLGLAIAQKNTSELSRDHVEKIGFDFVVAEECHRFDECDAYAELYGGAVIDIEYSDDLRAAFTDVCADPDAPASTILRDRGLSEPGDPSYVFDRCGS